MSFRFNVKITDPQGVVVFSEQILGNNECFAGEYLERLGLGQDGDCIDGVVNLKDLIDCFKEYHVKYLFPRLKDCTAESSSG